MNREYKGDGFLMLSSCYDFKCPNCGRKLELNSGNDHGYASGESVDQKCLGCGKKIKLSFGSWHLLEIVEEERVKTPLISEEHIGNIFVPIITALHPSRSVIVLTGDDINDLNNCIRRFTEYDFETHSAGLTDAIRNKLMGFGVNLPTAQLLSRAWIKPELIQSGVSYENISEEHVIRIVEPILSRLSEYHKIDLSDKQVEELKNCIRLFKEPDFEKASDALTEAIYNKLKEFGVDDITAKRCSWKWSD